MRNSLLRIAAVIGIAAAGVVAVAVLLAPQAMRLADATHGEVAGINLDPLAERSIVYDRNGVVLAVLHEEENRAPIALADVPAHVIDTVLAVEDENFYSHKGLNIRATLRALFENVSAGEIEQGGSTITMQVVKNSLLTSKQDLSRKTKEAILARRLEGVMTKDQILERYLNTIYLGNHAYGIQAGAEIYFGESVAQLDWGEAALLAAIIRNPTGYDPITQPDRARERRHIALQRLVAVGKLAQADADLFDASPLPTTVHQVVPLPTDYFVEAVKQQLLDDTRLGATEAERYNAVFRGGLRIHTTVDPALQDQARAARDSVLPSGTALTPVPTTERYCRAIDGAPLAAPSPNAAAACFTDEDGRLFANGTAAIATVEPATGAVRAIVGGPGFDQYQYDIATLPPGRPTGSSFKTFTLLALLENGYVPNDTVEGRGPCKFKNPGGTPDPYQAENFEGGGGGPGTITQQTLRSSNCAYLRLGQIVGLDKVIEVAKRLGVTTDLQPVLSLPIGAFDVTPLEMAAAYAAIANDGIYNPPYFVDHVEDRTGETIFTHSDAGVRALSVQTARLAAQVLEANVRGGTGTKARLAEQPAAGKTGTAQDYADAWFVGFTPYYSTAVWMGATDGRVPMRSVGGIRVVGGSYPARIWGAFMGPAHDGLEPRSFEPPDPTRRGKGLRLPGEISPPTSQALASPAAPDTTTPAPTVSLPVPSVPTMPPMPSMPPTPSFTMPPGVTMPPGYKPDEDG